MNDVVIAWEFIYGVDVAIVSKLLRKPVKVVALNFIEHSTGRKAKIKAILYNMLFKNPNFHVGINCIGYLKEYERYYKFCRERVLEMPDCNFRTDMLEQPFSEGDGTIFCGGFIRDWEVFLETAKLLPQFKFVGVAHKNTNAEIFADKPKNTEIHIGMGIDEFYELLKKCSISAVLLPSTVPNGFTVMLQSAFLNRPVVAAECVGVNDLLYDKENDEWGGLTYEIGSAKDLADKIVRLFEDIELRKKICEVMLRNAKKRTAEAYSDKLLNYVKAL